VIEQAKGILMLMLALLLDRVREELRTRDGLRPPGAP
jgi:hypothetical protein